MIICPKCQAPKNELTDKDVIENDLRAGKVIVHLNCGSCNNVWDEIFFSSPSVLKLIQEIQQKMGETFVAKQNSNLIIK